MIQEVDDEADAALSAEIKAEFQADLEGTSYLIQLLPPKRRKSVIKAQFS